MQLEAITKNFQDFSLGPLNLALEPGNVLGFAGPNGSGKTTTLKIIMGLIRADGGRVKIQNHEVTRHDGAWKNHIGYVAEDHVFYEGWSGFKNLDLHARLHKNWCIETVENLAKRLDLDLNKRARNLSKGNRIKLALTAAMGYQPKILVLDEPTSGLDPVTRNEVLELLLDYVSGGERSVLFSTHIVPDIARIASEVTFLKNGRISLSGAPVDITENWRKIRFRFPFEKIELPGVVSHKVEGQTHLVVTSEHKLAAKQLEKAGAMVQDLNRISLDEAAVYILKGSAP